MNKSKIIHGRASTYTYHKCRCVLCKETQRVYMQNYRNTVRGKEVTKRIKKKRDKLETLSIRYIQENYPDVYERLRKEAEND